MMVLGMSLKVMSFGLMRGVEWLISGLEMWLSLICRLRRISTEFHLLCFSGFNHHRQPVLFGCALLVDDSESSLVWLFKALLSAMSGRQPVSVIVDLDWSVEAAVRKVFPNVRCRFCKWHILKEARESLSHVFDEHESFEGELHECVNAEMVDEFEFYWNSFVTRFGLGGNEWIQSVYGCRHQWVPAYLRSTFFAEFAPSRKCECKSSLFEGFISAETNSQVFIQQCEKALDCRYEKEVKAEFDTTYAIPILKTLSPMEKQASETYTSKIFKKFQEELTQSVDFTADKVNDEGDTGIYQVVKLGEEHKVYKVVFNAPQIRASCSCQMFEYCGILCRHILKVFSAANIQALPSHYILKRWTRNARSEGENDSSNGLIAVEVNVESQDKDMGMPQSLTWRYNSLCREAMKFVEDGATSPEIYSIALCALKEAVEKVAMAKQKDEKIEPADIVPNEMRVQPSRIELQDTLLAVKSVSSDKVGLVTFFNPLSEVAKTTVSQEFRQKQPLEEGQLLQPPCNLLLVPTLPSSSHLLSAAAPLALKTSNGNFDGSTPVLVSLSAGNISKEDSNHGQANSQPSPGCPAVQIGQTSTTPVFSGNTTNTGSSETQVMAVPMTLFVPLFSNSSTPSSGAGTNSNIALIASAPTIQADANRSCPSQALSPSQTNIPVGTLQKGAQPPASSEPLANSVRATAIAAGARIASPTAAASIIKAMQLKTPIHIKAGASSPARSTSPSDLGSPVLKPSSLPTDTSMAQNVLMDPGLNAGNSGGAVESPEKRGMDFTDSSDDEEMTYAGD
ncbi:protein FAR1-RELATED SEQUENCE 1-like isoform X1 [Dioscorea cayenensis subsp. rotundata]|uniref:Protein FAR1-RELATED SEQUENCE n=1 Tax=Dioscorea cayennensis subsp. rotundata TaxID=55577 RepID=A0AB40CM12_DIOCR|nr:protein FAR1-RELATED SEQUENCE 1-like isoform X1 [Dioscorea cayenensis subsp. rotundata]